MSWRPWTSRGSPTSDTSLDQRLDHQEQVGGAGAGQAGHGVEEVLGHPHHGADGAEDAARPSEVVVAGVAARGDGRRARPTRAGVFGMARTTAASEAEGGLDGAGRDARRRSTARAPRPGARRQRRRRRRRRASPRGRRLRRAVGGSATTVTPGRSARPAAAAGPRRARRRPARSAAPSRMRSRPPTRAAPMLPPPNTTSSHASPRRRLREPLDPAWPEPHFPDPARTPPDPPGCVRQRARIGSAPTHASATRPATLRRAARPIVTAAPVSGFVREQRDENLRTGRRSRWRRAGRKQRSTVAYSVPSTRSSSSSVERRQRQLAAQEHGVLDPDREVGTDEPVVAAQQVLVELGVVLLRRRHHVRLVPQRPLAEREPDRGDVLLLAPHPHVPAPRHPGRRDRPRR